MFVFIKLKEEISVIELGINEITGSIRTDFFHKKLLSSNCYTNKTEAKKVLCYLLDTQTICLLDLQTKMNLDLIEHNTMISGLILNPTCSKLLFKDSKKNLYIYDLATKSKYNLAQNVNYWGWVPNSNVIVCQSNDKLLVWYSSDYLLN